MTESLIYLRGYLSASEYRKKVLLTLKDKALTPSDIARKIGIHQSHVSMTLTQLTKKNLTRCLTPKMKKGRLYELTATGRKLLKEI